MESSCFISKGNKEVTMLKLTLKPGQYIDIGDDIKVIFSGGSANNIHLLIEAPRELNIVRSTVKKASEDVKQYKKETGISPEAQREIVQILMREKRKNKDRDNNV
jgi:carbon storage regulator